MDGVRRMKYRLFPPFPYITTMIIYKSAGAALLLFVSALSSLPLAGCFNSKFLNRDDDDRRSRERRKNDKQENPLALINECGERGRAGGRAMMRLYVVYRVRDQKKETTLFTGLVLTNRLCVDV